MKQWMRVVAVAVSVLAAGQGFAQSLEKSYADMCATPAKKKTEACQVMAKALVAKVQGNLAADDRNASVENSNASAARGRNGSNAKPEVDAKIARWGLVGKMMGRQFVSYSPGNDIHWEYTSGYEWIVPGEHARAYSIGPDGEKQPAGELRWNSQTNRIDLINSQGVVWGYKIPDGGGTVSVIGEAKGRTVEQSDGSFRSDVYSPVNGSNTSFSYENTPEGKQLAFQAAYRDKKRAQDAADAEALARRAEQHAKADRFLNAVGAAQQALTQAGEVWDATHDQATDPELLADEDLAPLAQATQPAEHTPREDSTRAGKPLRFVLDIGLVNKPGDTVNPTCYSNVITRPGPPGWGGGGFLPDGSAEQAREVVESFKEQFVARCRASGRDITGEGNFHWTWNETRDGDQQVSNAHARYHEDVSVDL